MTILRILPLLAILGASGAQANEALIRQTLEAKPGVLKVEAAQPSPIAGVWEVRLRTTEGVRIIYTDAQANYLLIGELYEGKTDRNLTEERMRKLSAIDMGALPYELAVKVRRGSGKRTLVVFSDPYCPACQEFEKTLANVDDITIYYFMYPVIRPELSDQSRAVWCSADRSKAWLDLAQRRKPPSASPKCDTPIEKILELGKQLEVRSTPTLFFASGERIRGGPQATQLRSLLDENAKTVLTK